MTVIAARDNDSSLRVPNLKRKVIVADDVTFNRVILSRILVRLGYEVLEASTGEQAVQAFRDQLKEDDGLFCVLMDINMPEMDGLEASMRIRQLEAQAAERPLAPAVDEATVPSRGEEDFATTPTDAHNRPFHRVPIWAVSSCSETEQYCSPAFAHIREDPPEGPPWKLAGIDAFMGKPVNAGQLTDMLVQLQRELNERYAAVEQGRRADDSLITNSESTVVLKRSRSSSPEEMSPTKRCRSDADEDAEFSGMGALGKLEEESNLLVESCKQ